MAMEIFERGIDVSKHNGNINWQQVKGAGIDFAIIRAGYGRLVSQKDVKFEDNYKQAGEAGIKRGAYWYSYAVTEEDARKEAEACLECIKGKQFEYPIYYDIEEDRQLKLGKAKVSAIINTFCKILEANGYWVGCYSNTSTLNNYYTEGTQKDYTIWVAHWGVQQPTYKNAYDVWQYSDKGKITGITGNVDLDYSYRDLFTAIKTAGKNGFAKPEIVEPIPEEDKKCGCCCCKG